MNLTPEEQYKAQQQAEARANGTAFPGSLRDAFTAGDIECNGWKIRPVVAYDWQILLKINHPLYEIVQEIKQTGQFPEAMVLDWTEKQKSELVYIFSRPCAQVDDVLETGIPAFEKAAKREVAMKIAVPESITVLVMHVLKQVVDSWKTFPNFQPKEAKEDDRPFEHENNRMPATASVGG